MCNKYGVFGACKNVDWNKLGALLSGKKLQTVECTDSIDVDLVWICWLQWYDDVRRSNVLPEIYRLGLLWSETSKKEASLAKSWEV